MICSLLAVPKLQHDPIDAIAIESATVIFNCTFDGGPSSAVDIEWRGPAAVSPLLNSSTINNNDGTFTNTLTLRDVSANHTGSYRCTARYNNPLCTGSADSSMANLVVIVAPTPLNRSITPNIVNDGDNVTFTFVFSSLPLFTNLLCNGPGNFEMELSDDAMMTISAALNLLSVNYTVGGYYTCTANNSAGSTDAMALLLVRPVVEPQIVLAKNGGNATLTCLAQPLPEPSYSWEMLRDSNDSDTFPDEFGFVSGSGENMMATHPFLDFEPVQYGDAGTYRCMVKINGTWLFSDEVLLAGEIIVIYECIL